MLTPPSPESNEDPAQVDRYPSRLGAKWQWGSSDAIFVGVLIVACGLSAFVGVAAPLGSFAHDTFFFLDNAYRVAQGQVPHRDFSSAWGPVMYLIDAAGLLLSGMRPSGFGYANALFGALIGLWAFLIVRTRWPSASACALGIFTVLLITAPFPISSNPFDFGYAMSYNRYGYALFGIIMMECAADAPSAQAGVGQRTRGAISTGIALGLLAFLKISYAIVAGPFVVILTIVAGAGRMRRFIGLSSGFAIVAVLVLGYLRFDVSDMVQDLAMAATARRLSLQPWQLIGGLDLGQSVLIALFAAGLICGGRTGVDRAARFHAALFALLTVAVGYLLLISNQQSDTFPLNGYAAVALVAAYGPLMTGKLLQWPGFTPRFPRNLLLGVCFLPFCVVNGISVAGAAVERAWPIRAQVIPLEFAERGRSLRFGPVIGERQSETIGADYVEAVNDGLALLRRHSGAGDGVLAFDEFNPFNYLLDRPSPRGGFAATAYDYVFCDAAYPTADRFFGDTRYVMVRKYKEGGPDITERDNVLGLMRIYGSALRSHFTVVAETKHWVLWHRADAFEGVGSR